MRPIFNLSKVQILVKNRLKGKIFSRQNETSLLRVLAIEEIAIFALYLTLLLLLKCRHNKWASSEESRDANFRFAAGPALKRRELSELLLLAYRRRSSLNSLLFSAGQVPDRKIKTFPILKFRNVRNNEKKLHLKFKEAQI